MLLLTSYPNSLFEEKASSTRAHELLEQLEFKKNSSFVCELEN